MARFLGRLIRWALVAYALMTLALIGWTFLWPTPDARAVAQADAIVCLGGGMTPNGTLADAVLTRIERCVELHEAGVAPVIVFSGGVARPQGPSAGGQMARFAAGLGLPPEAAVIEGASQSTLHNALFSLDLIPSATRVVVVTEAFHLPRSWASFHWAAWELDRPLSVSLVMSEPVRRTAQGTINWRILVRESLAIWFNAGRAVLYQGGALAGVPESSRIDWLH